MQIITNPICPYCFSREVNEWVRDRKTSEKTKKEIKKRLSKLSFNAGNTPSNTKCILCGQKRVNLCTFCFTLKAFKIIKESADKPTLKDFEEDFNPAIWTL